MALDHGAAYLALGSSFAAGPGLLPRAPGSPRRSGRSSSNYAHLLAKHLGLELDDQTYSGATMTEIAGIKHLGRPAQVSALTSATRLVTITAGGNDVGYLPRLTLASLPIPLRAVYSAEVARLGGPAANDSAFDELHDALTTLIARVRADSGAIIIVTDYLTILPAEDSLDPSPLPARVAQWGRAIAGRLTETLRETAAAEGAVFVPLARLSAEHHAWASDPWTRRFHLSLRGGAPYHPTLAGMAAAAEAIRESVGGLLDSPAP